MYTLFVYRDDECEMTHFDNVGEAVFAFIRAQMQGHYVNLRQGQEVLFTANQ